MMPTRIFEIDATWGLEYDPDNNDAFVAVRRNGRKQRKKSLNDFEAALFWALKEMPQ